MYSPLRSSTPEFLTSEIDDVSQKLRPVGWSGSGQATTESARASRRAIRAWPSALGWKSTGMDGQFGRIEIVECIRNVDVRSELGGLRRSRSRRCSSVSTLGPRAGSIPRCTVRPWLGNLDGVQCHVQRRSGQNSAFPLARRASSSTLIKTKTPRIPQNKASGRPKPQIPRSQYD